jgi:Domain of unknown function (DUF4214)
MLKFAVAILAIAFIAVTAAAQAPTLQITQPDGPNLPSELWYGNVKVKPLRFRPGTNIPITIDDADFFISQNYVDFLARFGDQGGVSYWTGQITGCGVDTTCIYNRRAAVSAAFFIELEFQKTGFYVYRMYAGSLGRKPGYSEFMPDRRQIDASNLDPSKATFANAWVQRPEFVAKYPASLSNSAFVDAVLATMKAYDGTDLTANRTTYINTANASGRGAATQQIVEDTSFQNKEFNPSFVLMQYFGYLRRDIDQGGFDFWLNILNNKLPGDNISYQKMVCAFITSAEYQLRFGSTATQNDRGCANIQ